MLQHIREMVASKPLSTFFAIGGIMYLASSLVVPYGRETIVIDARAADAIVNRAADRLGRDLTPAERTEALQRHVDEEILVREAHRRGVHFGLGRARNRLLRRMRLELSQGLPEPSRAQLRAYYRTNATRFETGETVMFAHVFFTAESFATADTARVQSALNAGADFEGLGDAFWLGPVLRMPLDRLAGALGAAFAQQVFSLPLDTWSGPMESVRGVHYVRIVGRHPSTLIDFDIVENTVRMHWVSDKRTDLMDRRMTRIRERYEITVEQ